MPSFLAVQAIELREVCWWLQLHWRLYIKCPLGTHEYRLTLTTRMVHQDRTVPKSVRWGRQRMSWMWLTVGRDIRHWRESGENHRPESCPTVKTSVPLCSCSVDASCNTCQASDTLQHFGTSVFKEDNQAVRLDCDLSCAESVECNTAGLVQVLCSFLHVDFGYAFHLYRLQSDM